MFSVDKSIQIGDNRASFFAIQAGLAFKQGYGTYAGRLSFINPRLDEPGGDLAHSLLVEVCFD